MKYKIIFLLSFIIALTLSIISCDHGSDDNIIDTTQQSGEEFYDVETGITYLTNPNRELYTREENSLVKGSNVHGTWNDASGRVEIKMWRCFNDSVISQPQITCSLPDDYVVVGGGAYS